MNRGRHDGGLSFAICVSTPSSGGRSRMVVFFSTAFLGNWTSRRCCRWIYRAGWFSRWRFSSESGCGRFASRFFRLSMMMRRSTGRLQPFGGRNLIPFAGRSGSSPADHGFDAFSPLRWSGGRFILHGSHLGNLLPQRLDLLVVTNLWSSGWCFGRRNRSFTLPLLFHEVFQLLRRRVGFAHEITLADAFDEIHVLHFCRKCSNKITLYISIGGSL